MVNAAGLRDYIARLKQDALLLDTKPFLHSVSIGFHAHLGEEGSWGGRSLGDAYCSMSFKPPTSQNFSNLAGRVTNIEWETTDERYDYVEIGIWLASDADTLEDLDGVMSTPPQAIYLLKAAGVTVPDDWDGDYPQDYNPFRLVQDDVEPPSEPECWNCGTQNPDGGNGYGKCIKCGSHLRHG